ncbi:MAG: T9SS type A sorting domain-containing protein [Nitrososphaerales archaeon]
MKRNFLAKSLLTAFLTISLSVQLVRAQELINTVVIADSLLTNKQLSRKSLFLADHKTQELKIVTIGNIRNRQSGNLVSVVVPGRSGEFFFQGRYIELLDSVQYTWEGELVLNNNGVAEMDTNSDGRLLLFYKNDRIFGQLVIDTLSYLIRDLSGGLNALVLQKQLDSSDCCIMSSYGVGSGLGNGQSIQNRDLTICPVSVLVCYTETVLAKAPDIVDMAEMGGFITNRTVRKSFVEPIDLKFNIKAYHEILKSDWEETGTNDDIRTISGISSVKSLRTSLKADIVLILTDDVYTAFTGAVTAYGFDDGSKKDSAYALVDYNAIAGSRLTFPHEIFHLFNARHEIRSVCGSGVDDTPFNRHWSHGYLVNTKNDGNEKKKTKRTMMAVCIPWIIKVRLEQLSNPDVKYKKWNSGRADIADNARTVNDNACMVANYFPSDDVPFVSISAPSEGCYLHHFELSGDISGPIPTPHEYIWRYSTDGLNWSQPSQNMIDFDIYLNYPVGAVIFFELKAGHVGGPWSYAYASITVIDEYHHCLRETTTSTSEVNNSSGEKYLLYPNPADEYISVSSNDDFSKDINVSINDMLGRTYLTMKTCTNDCKIPTIGLNNGIYFVVIKNISSGQSFSKKFTILR